RPTGPRRRSPRRATASSSGRSATDAAPCRRGSTCRTTSAGSSSTTSARCRRSNAPPATPRRSLRRGARLLDRGRLAAIDLGSNTVRLLVADVLEGRVQVVEATQRVTRLGEGLAASGRLGGAPAQRTAATVIEYVARARRAGAE